MLIPRGMRRPLLLVCLAALLPDIVDHVPDDLRKHTGWAIPVLPNLFPCHFTGTTSSWPGRSGPKWIVSTVNHLIVVAFCAVALVRTQHLLRLPWRRESPTGLGQPRIFFRTSPFRTSWRGHRPSARSAPFLRGLAGLVGGMVAR